MKTVVKTTTSAILRSYLMWVGTEHYEGIDAYSDEAVTLGVSKRLPSVGAAKAMMEPGTVIFVAHDEGEATDCPACLGTVECPECRKRSGEITALLAAVAKIKEAFADFGSEAPAGKKRSVMIRSNKATKLAEACLACDHCGGKGKANGGTGGQVGSQRCEVQAEWEPIPIGMLPSGVRSPGASLWHAVCSLRSKPARASGAARCDAFGWCGRRR